MIYVNPMYAQGIVESSVRRFGGPSFSRIWAEDALMAEKPQLGAL